MKLRIHDRVVPVLLVAMCVGMLCTDLFAWTKEIEDAAKAVAGGTATPQQLAVAFQNNQAINQMAAAGKLPQSVYVANQQKFDAINKTFIEKAAADAGLKANQQVKAPGSTPKPGADTDIIVTKGKGQTEPITQGQVEKMNQAYQKNVQQFLNNRGVKPQGPVNTQTDFMPHPEHTTPQEFQKINQNINKAGGTAYENPAAAKVEAQLRNGQKINVNEAGQYASEMQKLAQQKLNHANQLNTEAAKLPPGDPRRAELSAEAQINRSQAAKYTERINTVGETVCKQNGIPPAKTAPMDSPLSSSVHNANVNRGSGSIKDTHVVGALGDKAVNDAAKNFSDNMSKVIKANPNAPGAKDAVQNIADQAKNMTPSQKGEVIDNVRRTAGDKAAQDVANAMKNTKPSAPSSGTESGGGKSTAGEPGSGVKGTGEPGGIGGQKGGGVGPRTGEVTAPGAGAGKGEVAGPKTGEVGTGAGGAKGTGEVRGPSVPAKPGTVESGIIKSGTGEAPGAGGGAKGEGIISKGMKVLGPIMIIKDGIERIHSVATKTGEAQSEEATKQLGGFTGGTAGATGGAIIGAKAGALIGSIFGPVGATVGGVVGGLYGGYTGYKKGAEAGEKNAGGVMNWMAGNNKTTQESDKAAGLHGVADGLYGAMVKNGVPPDRAKDITDRIKSGDPDAIKEVRQINKELHDKQQQAQTKPDTQTPDDKSKTTGQGGKGQGNGDATQKPDGTDGGKSQAGADKGAGDKTGVKDGDKGGDKTGGTGDGDKTDVGQGGDKGTKDGGGKGGDRTTDLGNKEAGSTGQTGGGDDGSKQGGGDDGGKKGSGATGGGIADFTDRRGQKTGRKSDMDISKVNTDSQQEETSSDNKTKDADKTKDKGGADSQTTVNDGASKSASKQNEQSWGTAIGDGVEQGAKQGATAIGTAIGAAGAGHIISTLFPTSGGGKSGSGDGSQDGSSGGGNSSTVSGGGKAASGGAKSGSGGGKTGSGGGNKPGAGGGNVSPGVGTSTGGTAGGGATTTAVGGGAPAGTQVITVSGGATAGSGTGTAGGTNAVGGTSGSASGGQSLAPVDHTVNGGAALAGRTVVGIRATVNYNAYGIPDTFQVVYNGGVVGSSGHMSGSGTVVGTGQGASPAVIVRVLSPDSGTAWECSWSVDYFVQ